MNKLLLTSVGLLALVAAPASAKDPVFATPAQTRPLSILSTPPADGSEQQKQELAELHEMEAERTEAQAKAAKFDDEHEDFFVFETVFGDKFAAENLPVTAGFGKKISADESGNAAPVDDHPVEVHCSRPGVSARYSEGANGDPPVGSGRRAT